MTFSVKALIGVTDRISRPLEQMNRQIRATLAPIERLRRQRVDLSRSLGLDRLSRSFGALRSQVSGLLLPLGVGGGGVMFGLGQFSRGIIDASAQMEKFGAMLTSITGSAEGAQTALAWIRDFATETPLQITEVTDAFVRLKTFGLDPTDGTMKALVDQMAKTGGGAAELNGIILAVGQAWTKGKLQGEEALQLLERGVPVWDLLSEKTGRTAAALQDMASKGELGRDAIRVLIQEIGKSSSGAAAEQMKTFNGLMSNLADRWTNFQIAIGDAGFFDAVKDAIGGLLDTVEDMARSGALQALASDISNGLTAGLRGLVDTVREIDLRGLVAEMRGFFASVAAGIAYVGGLRNVLIGLGVVMSGPLIAALASVAGAIARIGIALAANPIGLAVMGIAAGVYLIYDNWGGIDRWFETKMGSVRDALDSSLLDGLAEVGRQFNPARVFAEGIDGLGAYLFGADLAGFADKALTAGEALVMKLVEGVRNAVSTAVAEFSRMGEQMMQGLIDGLEAKLAKVQETIEQIGKDVAGWFARQLGIESPSRVFMGFGQNIAEGLAQGIERGGLRAARSVAVLSAATLAPVAGPAVAGPLGAGGGAGLSGQATVEIRVRAEPGTEVRRTEARSTGGIRANVGRTDADLTGPY